MIQPGDSSTFSYQVPPERTVPRLLPESPEFQEIPPVFATGYLVGLLEWVCARHLRECGYLGEGQTSVGTHIDVSHTAATLPGQSVTVVVTCTAVQGRTVTWEVTAHDERDQITTGRHQRTLVDRQRFLGGLEKKAEQVGVASPTRS